MEAAKEAHKAGVKVVERGTVVSVAALGVAVMRAEVSWEIMAAVAAGARGKVAAAKVVAIVAMVVMVVMVVSVAALVGEFDVVMEAETAMGTGAAREVAASAVSMATAVESVWEMVLKVVS